jgi:antitoxin (DNA-binding transcriptional repressor) of toxin-antitoxin stability system
MLSVASVEVQNKFGSIANIVKGGEPVAVTQYGTPTLMILPFALAGEALRALNARRLADFMAGMPAVNAGAPELSTVELTALVKQLRSGDAA